tara:strand:- start:117 stop:380 length:264 start_codon:yes stop_codon:yes gene_type:complete
MSDENKEILDQVTELISSKKEQLKEKKVNDEQTLQTKKTIQEKKQPDDSHGTSVDLLIKKEVQNWIEKNAEKIAKEIISEQAKKIFK